MAACIPSLLSPMCRRARLFPNTTPKHLLGSFIQAQNAAGGAPPQNTTGAAAVDSPLSARTVGGTRGQQSL